MGPGYILVDWASCDGCGRCADSCERGAIALRSAAPKDATLPAVPRPAAKSKAAKGSRSAARATVIATPWSLPEAGLALVYAAALYVAAQALPGAVTHAPVWSGMVLVAYNLAVAGLLHFLARRRSLSAGVAFRANVAPEWSSFGLAVALAVGCWFISLGYRAGTSLLGLLPPSAEGPELATLFGSGVTGALFTVLVVVIAGPILEEALLRGVVLGALKDRLGSWPAIALSAVAYSLLHASPWSFVPLTVLGLALGWLAARSRSLWTPIVAHIGYNALLVGAALYKAMGA